MFLKLAQKKWRQKSFHLLYNRTRTSDSVAVQLATELTCSIFQSRVKAHNILNVAYSFMRQNLRVAL